MLVALVIAAVCKPLVEWGAYSKPIVFSPLGWAYDWIHYVFPIGLIWLAFAGFPNGQAHKQPVAAWVVLASLAMSPLFLLSGVSVALTKRFASPTDDTAAWIQWGLYVCMLLWSVLLIARIVAALHTRRPVRVALTTLLMGLLTLQSWALPTSAWTRDYTKESTEEPSPPSLTLSQSVFFSQEELLAHSLRELKPSEPGAPRVYGLVYAPSDEQVFLNENAMIDEVFNARLNTEGRLVRLVNHPSTTDTLPWATPYNLQRSLQTLATRMDTSKDILVIYLTSHGGRDHKLAASHWPLQVDPLTADELRKWLDDAGIKFRAIAVSACYSGGWIAPLANPDTLIMTASDAEHTSYGCGSQSDLTYFGQAVFSEALRERTTSLEDAFADAVPRIQERESAAKKKDGFSNPQISVGDGFRTQWTHWAHAAPP
jgi:uncharacterized membrane protein